jgi:large subunit ribosomal protein L2
MALVKMKPTSPGRRGMVKVVTEGLYKGRPFAALVEKKSKTAGRNNNGHITTRHIGGGHKQHYRLVDFKRNDKDGIPAKVERIEYDPNRTAHIALLCYADGERAVHHRHQRHGCRRQRHERRGSADQAGNCLPIRNIPVGTVMHCVEMLPGKGAQMARTAGAGCRADGP